MTYCRLWEGKILYALEDILERVWSGWEAGAAQTKELWSQLPSEPVWNQLGFLLVSLDCKEGWALKNWCLLTVVLEKTLESPLGCKEIQPVSPKGDQPWVFIGKTDAEAETPVLWPPHSKSWLMWKDCDAGKDWGQEEKGKTEDEMVGWHHQLDGHGFGWTLGSWWWTRRPGVLQGMGSQRVRHDWATEQQEGSQAY